MKVLTKAPPGSPDWLAARKGRITATRGANVLCSAIDGVSTYKTALQEYKALSDELLVGDVAPNGVHAPEAHDDETEYEDQPYDPDNPAELQWGLDSEPVHIKMLTRETGYTFTPEHAVFQDEEHPWLAASIDSFVSAPQRPDPGVGELKAPTRKGILKWKDGKQPLLFQVQTAIELRVTKLQWGLLSALIAPNVRWNAVEWDQDIHDWIMDGLVSFWDAVQNGRAPRPRPVEADLAIMRAMAQPEKGKIVYLSPAAMEWRDRREEAKATIKANEQIVSEANLALIDAIGDAGLGVFPDGTGYTFSGQTKTMKATEARVVQIAPFLRYTKSAL